MYPEGFERVRVGLNKGCTEVSPDVHYKVGCGLVAPGLLRTVFAISVSKTADELTNTHTLLTVTF
jgi:hypothetical protein